MPAIAGPTTRAPWKIEEFSAIALGKSSFPTICHKKSLPDRDIKRINDTHQERDKNQFPNVIIFARCQPRQRKP